MPLTVQDAIVTLTAIAAALVILRRVFTTVRPGTPGPSKCASCPAAQQHAKPAEFVGMPIARPHN